MIVTSHIDTPVGKMLAGVYANKLCLLDYEHRRMMPAIRKRLRSALAAGFKEGEHELFVQVQQQLNEYFNGKRKAFELPLMLTGTDFQKRVWQALTDIPYGETRTYMQQAKTLGDEKAIRAVARANGENCLAIVVPCHRIVGSDGSLTGYAGGLKAKKWLLEHEARVAGRSIQGTIF